MAQSCGPEVSEDFALCRLLSYTLALHGATSLVLFPNADGHIIRNSQLFSLGMDGDVSILAASLDIIHLARKRLNPRTKSVLR